MRTRHLILILAVAVLAAAQSPPRQDPTKPTAWKVWYDDGTGLRIFHSSTHTWDDIPSAPGIQVILTCEDAPPFGANVRRVPRRMVKGSNWYWIDALGVPRQSLGQDGKPDGFPDTPVGNPPAAAAGRSPRAGVTIDDEVYENYRRMAVRDFGCDVP